MGWWKPLKNQKWRRMSGIFSRTIPQNTSQKVKKCLENNYMSLYHNKYTVQTLIPLKMSGKMLNDNFTSTQLDLMEHMNCGID
jgi:hypothetical protein